MRFVTAIVHLWTTEYVKDKRGTVSTRLLTIALLGLAALAAQASAKTIHFTENASLHLTGSSGRYLLETGTARGTYDCTLTARFRISSASSMSGTFTVYPKGGSVTGTASGRVEVAGRFAYYGGTMTIVKGTGSFKHVQRTTIGVSGTIDRRTYALTVKAHGTLRT